MIIKLQKLFFALSLCILANNCWAGTLDDVKSRGYLKCGVNQYLPGFSYTNDDGSWAGFDVDICRAIAAAIFQDPTKITFSPLSAKERFTALQTGEIDVLSRNTTWTFARDAGLGIEFTNITFFDTQGFMVRKKTGITKAKDLKGMAICTSTGTTTELNVADFFTSHKLPYNILTFEKAEEVVAAYDAGRCDVYSGDKASLYAQKLRISDPENHIILDDDISKEPLAVAVRHKDNQWADVVRWVINGLINAEELGVTSTNLNTQLATKHSETRRLLGLRGNLATSLNLSQTFMQDVIKAVGNYGEIFERNLGPKSNVKLGRKVNNLWNNGGVLYSPPFR